MYSSNKDELDQQFNVKTHTMLEAWNSTGIRQLRKDLIAGREPAACSSCWRCESTDHTQGASVRLQAANTHIPISTIMERIDYAAAHDGHISDNPTDFQIMSGNLCNLACKMCGPSYSNTWIKFFQSRGFDELPQIKFSRIGRFPAAPSDHKIYAQVNQDWPTTNPLSGVFREYYSSIRHIFLTGGEPTLITQNIEFLEDLVSTGHSQHIRMRFSTNLTNINRRLLDTLYHFETIGINLSLDAMDDIAYIQRTPSNWSQILRNTDIIMSWIVDYRRLTSKNTNASVNTVVTSLNIHHVLDLWIFLAERYTKDFHMSFSIIANTHDNYFVGQVPTAVISEILEKLPLASQRILAHSPSLAPTLERFEFYLRQDIYADNYQDMQHLLNNMQGLHPDLNIAEIYRIYYPDAV